jgi:hypothetical protein
MGSWTDDQNREGDDARGTDQRPHAEMVDVHDPITVEEATTALMLWVAIGLAAMVIAFLLLAA